MVNGENGVNGLYVLHPVEVVLEKGIGSVIPLLQHLGAIIVLDLMSRLIIVIMLNAQVINCIYIFFHSFNQFKS